MGLLAAAIVLEIVPAIAWWKLRTGKAGARWWAVAASVLCLPLPMPGILRFSLRMAHSWAVVATSFHLPRQLVELVVGCTGQRARPEGVVFSEAAQAFGDAESLEVIALLEVVAGVVGRHPVRD